MAHNHNTKPKHQLIQAQKKADKPINLPVDHYIKNCHRFLKQTNSLQPKWMSTAHL